MWARLEPEERGRLGERFRDYHFALAKALYNEESKEVHAIRAIAQLALPNLLAAVRQSLEAQATYAAIFTSNVNQFLGYFGLTRERADLICRVHALAEQVGSEPWYLARVGRGEVLFQAGRLAEATQVFAEVVAGLGEQPSYRRCVTLRALGRCYWLQRQSAKAEALLRHAIAEAATLGQSRSATRELGALQGELAGVLSETGDYAGAHAAYQAAIMIAMKIGDLRNAAVAMGELGTLALREGDLVEAERCYQDVLVTFQQFSEPESEAAVWHQLGIVYSMARQWEPAERAYRAAAELKERQGLFTGPSGVVATWHQLAWMIARSGRFSEAEGWYRKALAAGRGVADPESLAGTLANLANLLTRLPGRLDEARTLAEEALALHEKLDPTAAEIWKTYSILAGIAGQQGDTLAAARYRHAEQAAWAAFPGSRQALREHGPLIAAVVQTVARSAGRADLEQALEPTIEQGWGDLVTAIRRVLDGERDPESLCDPLDNEDALIIQTILAGIRDPDSIRDLLD